MDLTLKKQSEDEPSLYHMWSHSQWMRHIFEARNLNVYCVVLTWYLYNVLNFNKQFGATNTQIMLRECPKGCTRAPEVVS